MNLRELQKSLKIPTLIRRRVAVVEDPTKWVNSAKKKYNGGGHGSISGYLEHPPDQLLVLRLCD